MPQAPANRMAVLTDEDLFTPTLTEEDDAVGFERPWSPASLVVLAFFFGVPAGGSLLAWNFARLGARGKVLPAAFAVIVATLLLAAARGWIDVHIQNEGTQQFFGFLFRALATATAGAVAWMQRRRYRVFRGSTAEPGKLLLPGILAAVLSLAIQLGLSILFYNLFAR